MTFSLITSPNARFAVPSGPHYGYAKDTIFGSHRSIESLRYTGCIGIVTFEPSTGTYTLCHIPPAGLGTTTSASYSRFLADNTNPATSHVWVVGGHSHTSVPASIATLLTTAGLTPPTGFTGPRGRACDVTVHGAGLTIETRYSGTHTPGTTTVVSWGIGLMPSAPLTI